MKLISKILIISAVLLFCTFSLASYITKESDFKYEAGLKITKDGQIIENMVFYDIPIGIVLWSSNNFVANCTFINCYDEGILIIGSNNTIKNCVFLECADGVELQKSSNNIFINCKFLNNTHAGIDAIKNNNNYNRFYYCLFYGSPFGCFFSQSKNNEFIDCIFMFNHKDVVEKK